MTKRTRHLFVFSANFAFAGDLISRAIDATFSRRDTLIPGDLPVGLAPRFFADEGKAMQWRRYLERNGLPGTPLHFDPVGEALRAFLELPLQALAQGKGFAANWEAGGPWR